MANSGASRREIADVNLLFEIRIRNRSCRRVGKANGSRECAPDDRLRVPTIGMTRSQVVGTAQGRLCPPYRLNYFFARTASGVSGCISGWAVANAGIAIAVSKMRLTVGYGERSICCMTATVP